MESTAKEVVIGYKDWAEHVIDSTLQIPGYKKLALLDQLRENYRFSHLYFYTDRSVLEEKAKGRTTMGYGIIQVDKEGVEINRTGVI